MRCLIRFLSKTAAGSVEQTDRIIDVPVITIGRATDKILHLKDRRARLEHARIEPKNGRMHIFSGSIVGVTVNGRSTRDAELSVGDAIEAGANVLRIIDAPEGIDLAMTFELNEAEIGDDTDQRWTDATAGVAGFSIRQLSWALLIAIVVLGFALPALTLTSPGVASSMRGSDLLPDDGFWSSGPVHSAHSTTAAECNACHVRPFQRVPDAACTECHDAIAHVDNVAPNVVGEIRCATCHKEHNEPEQLVNRHQRLCADCHADLGDDSVLLPASDFLDGHPEFRVSLMQPADDETWVSMRIDLDEAADANRSNLKFDHSAHLDPDGIIGPQGTVVVQCVDCHQLDAAGALMRPIAMDEHCSGCHTLTFDPDDPDRVVPHGDPPAVVQELVEYYSARLLGGDVESNAPRVRRPGQTLTREDRDRVAAEARSMALDVAADLFERQACATCHAVTRTSEDADLPWHVQPVRLTNAFYPHARFVHTAHDTEVTGCETCHAATASTTAQDLLMPGIETCRDCHGSGVARRNDASQIPSTCIMCHGFHVTASIE